MISLSVSDASASVSSVALMTIGRFCCAATNRSERGALGTYPVPALVPFIFATLRSCLIITCNESSVRFAWKWALLEILFELVQLPILFVVVDDDFSLLPICQCGASLSWTRWQKITSISSSVVPNQCSFLY